MRCVRFVGWKPGLTDGLAGWAYHIDQSPHVQTGLVIAVITGKHPSLNGHGKLCIGLVHQRNGRDAVNATHVSSSQ